MITSDALIGRTLRMLCLAGALTASASCASGPPSAGGDAPMPPLPVSGPNSEPRCPSGWFWNGASCQELGAPKPR